LSANVSKNEKVYDVVIEVIVYKKELENILSTFFFINGTKKIQTDKYTTTHIPKTIANFPHHGMLSNPRAKNNNIKRRLKLKLIVKKNLLTWW
jgi:hypothetical protein